MDLWESIRFKAGLMVALAVLLFLAASGIGQPHTVWLLRGVAVGAIVLYVVHRARGGGEGRSLRVRRPRSGGKGPP